MADTAVPLPDHPESRIMQWTALELRAIAAYGDRRAAEERARCLAEIECGLWIDMTTEEILDSIADAIRKGA